MDKLNVIASRVSHNMFIVDFSSNFQLWVRPLFAHGPFTDVEDVASVVLYECQELQAFAVDRPVRFPRDETRGFWSKGHVAQVDLGNLWVDTYEQFSGNPALDQRITNLLGGYGISLRDELLRGTFRQFEGEIPFYERNPLV